MATEDCFLKFPVTDARYRSIFNYDGYSAVAIGLVYGQDHNVILRKKPDLDAEIDTDARQRLETIREISQTLCQKSHVPYQGMKPLDHGKKGVVVQVDDDYVIRIQQGFLTERPKSQYILQPLTYYYCKEQDLTFEVLPRMEIDCTQEDVETIAFQAQKDGIFFWDKTPKNVGRDKNGRVYIIDPDSFQVKKPESPHMN